MEPLQTGKKAERFQVAGSPDRHPGCLSIASSGVPTVSRMEGAASNRPIACFTDACCKGPHSFKKWLKTWAKKLH